MIAAIKKYEESNMGEIIELFPKINKTNSDLPCSEYTSRGVKKATAAESVRSYDDIKLIRDFYLNNNRIRDYTLFTVGICTGLRISDLLRLKISDILNEDGSFKKYIYIREKKTGKLSSNSEDKCLITEAIQESVSRYLKTRPGYNLDDYLIYSSRAGNNNHRMSEISGWRILNDAQVSLDLPFHLSSHSMRKSFANIAACIGECNNVDMSKLISIQHMLKHSDYKTTMRYLKLTSIFTEKARNEVSDFVMGKTDKNSLEDALLVKENDESEKLNYVIDAINKLIDMSE